MSKNTPLLKSPLRYPGGKQRAISKIKNYFPQQIGEYREPFAGGASVFFHVAQALPHTKCWINDLNPELYHFWEQVQTNLSALVDAVWRVKRKSSEGRSLYQSLASSDTNAMTPLERATRFFILNRITFSGTIESGGYSEASFKSRFTESSIERLAALDGCFAHTEITNSDYFELLAKPGDDVFIFLDPPYLSKESSRLYGRKGNLHTGFDHARFACAMSQCRHKWLITYDDCDQVRELFKDFAYIYEWSLQYGMNNYKQGKAEKGKELFITNYPVEIIK